MKPVNIAHITSRRIAVAASLFAILVSASFLPAVTRAENKPLRVVIKPLTPFVMKVNGEYAGFSIDLWQALATRINRTSEFIWTETVKDQLASLEKGDADVAITGITINSDRESKFDFSEPMFDSGLQIMTGDQQSSGVFDLLRSVMTPKLGQVVALMLGVILVSGHIFMLYERKRDPEFPRGYIAGAWEGIWLAITNMITVDFHDRSTRSVFGRLLAVFWMFMAIFLVSNFTAAITAQLTSDQLKGDINSLGDLKGKQVISVEGTTASKFLTARGIAHETVKKIDEAYPLLLAGKAQAIVYDAPVLRYYANTEGRGKLRVVGDMFRPEYYGIALPQGSPLREDINQALLKMREDGAYQDIYTRWFGSN